MAKLTRRRAIHRTAAMLRTLDPASINYIYHLTLFLLRKQGKDGAAK